MKKLWGYVVLIFILALPWPCRSENRTEMDLSGNVLRFGIHVSAMGNLDPHSEMQRIIRTTPSPLVIDYAWRPNADICLTRFFHSDTTIVSGSKPDTNFSRYDKTAPFIRAARVETDPVTQIRILSDMAALPLLFTRQCYARSAAVDYGHSLVSTMALYPQFTEKTSLKRTPAR